MAPHVIRLRGPWIATPHGEGAVPQKVSLPSTWAALGWDGTNTLTLSRKFHAPTGLQPSDQVWLCISAMAGELFLNSSRVGNAVGQAAWDVTELLAKSNLVEWQVAHFPQPETTTPETWLEIRTLPS